MRGAGCQDDRAIQRRVQGFEIVHADLGKPGCQRNVDVAPDRHALKIGVVFNQGKLGIELRRVRHNVLDRLEFGHVKAGFHGHVEVGVTRWQARALIFCNRPRHATFAPVVGGERQMPVAEHAVELLQVVQRSTRGGEYVAAVIPEAVLLQFEILAGGRHELPHTSRLGAGHGLGVEGTFNKRQQGQLRWHVADFQLLHDVEQVFFGALCHPEDVVRATGVPDLPVLHQFALEVIHAVAAADALPQVYRRGNGSHAPGASSELHRRQRNRLARTGGAYGRRRFDGCAGPCNFSTRTQDQAVWIVRGDLRSITCGGRWSR